MCKVGGGLSKSNSCGCCKRSRWVSVTRGDREPRRPQSCSMALLYCVWKSPELCHRGWDIGHSLRHSLFTYLRFAATRLTSVGKDLEGFVGLEDNGAGWITVPGIGRCPENGRAMG